MKEPSIVICHSGSPTVTTNAQRQVIGRDMKEPTLVVVDHLAAPSVATHAQHQDDDHDLKRHERTHTGGKSFGYSQCCYKCTRLDVLRKHDKDPHC